jgi:hypothetical protein
MPDTVTPVDMIDVFLSHASADKDWIHSLKAEREYLGAVACLRFVASPSLPLVALEW